jgi:hypothetical protein
MGTGARKNGHLRARFRALTAVDARSALHVETLVNARGWRFLLLLLVYFVTIGWNRPDSVRSPGALAGRHGPGSDRGARGGVLG